MRKNIAKVLSAFEKRVAAKGDSKNTCSTDGKAIFSYSTKIAEWEENGLVRIHESSRSATTRNQISAIRQFFGEGRIMCSGHPDCELSAEIAQDCARVRAERFRSFVE